MNKALIHFKEKDKILYKAGINITLSKWEKPRDPFSELIESIISQQLSGKAASTIFARFKLLFPDEKIKPKILTRLSDTKIRKCGVSSNKTKYIKGIAQAVVNKKIILEELENLSDEEVVENLTKLKGVGSWTAEMYLMFTLGRHDVFSVQDIGIQNAMIKLYGLDKSSKKEDFIAISENWSPYRTTACRILWKSLDS